MSLLATIRHFFIPHESNNHRAKILHPTSLVALKILLVAVQVGLYVVTTTPMGRVLGYAANISPTEVVALTNQKRIDAGLNPLEENSTLSQAAQAKGADMLTKGYWAHVAPDGTQPWAFFLNAGYRYHYAGENLARDFSNPSAAVEAWMASPTHRDNMLSDKYDEIGIGVVEGNLAGVDTTIIVQFFGTRYADTIPQAVAQVPPIEEVVPEIPQPTLEPTPQPVEAPEVAQAEPSPVTAIGTVEGQVLVSPFTTTKGVSLAVVGLLFVIMIVDAALVSRRRIRRIGGRTFAHLSFLGMIITLAIILKAGQIL